MHHQRAKQTTKRPDEYLARDPIDSIVEMAMFFCENPDYIMPAHLMRRLLHLVQGQLKRMADRDRALGLDKDDKRTMYND